LYRSRPFRMVSMFSGRSGAESKAAPILLTLPLRRAQLYVDEMAVFLIDIAIGADVISCAWRCGCESEW
jgi:hypothetical protein